MSDDGTYDDNYEHDDEHDSAVITEKKKKLKRPKLYKVMLHNDHYTTMEFVVAVLINIFHQEHSKAFQIMMHVHKKGVGVAGVYSYEIAETKAHQVINLAREQKFPLRCTVEAE
tara:strand:+ start:557 stop:898 length:342 start_codon:yes stop_codon:yes gene_type:complete